MSGNGYLSAEYNSSLTHIGTSRLLERADGWWLERAIPDSPLRDGCGPYPLLCCNNWHGLDEDLRALGNEIVSFCAVTDPFGRFDKAILQQAFPDRLIPYKDHLVIDLTAPPESFVSAHHQRDTRRALRRVEITVVSDPSIYSDEWVSLYTGLMARYNIHGPAAFSSRSLKLQLLVPGMRMFKADIDGCTVGMQLWVEDGTAVYYHLAASSEEGYAVGASYALTWEALCYYHSLGIDRVDLGAAPDVSTAPGAGLLKFKTGWATGTKMTYLGGRILDRKKYNSLCQNILPSAYFPLYRISPTK